MTKIIKNIIHKKSKIFQKKFIFGLMKTGSISGLITIVILGQLIGPQQVNAATYNLIQNSWSGGITSNIADHLNNQTGWGQYSLNNGLTAGETLSLPVTTSIITKTSSTDFNSGIYSQSSLLGSGDGASIKLKESTFTTPKISNTQGGFVISLKSDGTVWGWGTNGSFSNLGINLYDTVNFSTPVRVLNADKTGFLEDIVSVSTALSNGIALKSDGTVWAWGYSSLSTMYVPTQVKGVGGIGYLTNIVAVEGAYNSFYALASDGTVYAWGNNTYGQLGNNTTSYSVYPVRVLGSSGSGYLSNIIAISAENTALALASDGTVYAWGDNTYGQVGNNSLVNAKLPVKVLSTTGQGELSNIVSISVGLTSSAAITSDGAVYTWGKNTTSGQLGNNSTTNSSIPVRVLGAGGAGYLSNITQISVARSHTLALASDGAVYAWGENSGNGMLGNNNTLNSYVPVRVLGVGGGWLSRQYNICFFRR